MLKINPENKCEIPTNTDYWWSG